MVKTKLLVAPFSHMQKSRFSHDGAHMNCLWSFYFTCTLRNWVLTTWTMDGHIQLKYAHKMNVEEF